MIIWQRADFARPSPPLFLRCFGILRCSGLLQQNAASVSIPANDTGPGLPRLPSISTVSTVSVIDFQKASKAHKAHKAHKVLTALESQKGPVSNAMLASQLLPPLP